ncbi:MAG: hypothetical protein IJ225_00905 [Solobacterium sp.]|nr:hypothetical protein [Solobacterium sp.]
MKFKGFRKVMNAILTAGILMGTTTTVQAEEWDDPQEWEAETSWEAPQAYNPYWGGYGNCTWSAWQIAYETTGIALPAFGRAGSWLNSAASMGYYVSSVPVENSIVVWSNHVGYVSAVSEDGSMIYVREGGYCGGYHEGWFPAYYPRSWQALYGYIYLY